MTIPRWATTVGVATMLLAASLGAADAIGEASPHPASLAPATADATATSRPAVLSTRVIGKSVNGHPIRAWELGDRHADVTAVAFGAQHGNERAGQTVLDSLRDGPPIAGVHLWVVPRVNPDGVLRGTRQNARGVDLNRNFPRHWKRITGYYYSGPRPASEPETRTLMRFLTNVKPDLAVSFHSPLYGLDVTGAKNRPFARRLSEDLNLPNKRLRCSGGCHGTLSQWSNHRLNGALVTVEFGSSPGEHYLHVSAPRGLVRAFGGHVTRP
jgi:protein MpaA